MKIIVTGANGYIGRNVVRVLTERGHSVTAVLLRNESESLHAFLDGATIFYGNIFELNNEQIKKLFPAESILLHLAWRAGFNHRDVTHLENVMNHFKFLVRASEAGVENISIAGTMHEVGYYVGEVCANTPCNPITPYGIAKNFLRQAIFDYASTKSNLSIQWLRFYYITGDDRQSNSIFRKILDADEKNEEFFPLNSGEMLYDFIDIKELSELVANKLEKKGSGIYNCSSGKPKSLRSHVEKFIIENNLKIKPKYNVFPARPYDSVAIWGKKDS